jgi:hypothetical protein
MAYCPLNLTAKMGKARRIGYKKKNLGYFALSRFIILPEAG